MKSTPLLRSENRIGDAWRGLERRQASTVRNPATGDAIGQVPECTEGDVQEAITAAARALPAWRSRPAAERSALLARLAALIRSHQEDLARLMTLEQGKPVAEAAREIEYGVSFVDWYAEEAKRVYGESVPAPAANRRVFVLREPIGVCAAITPWNFPNAMITRKVAPALAAGCTCICKPAPETPFSAIALAVLAEEAGFPPGVLNVITGDAPMIARMLMSSPVVRKVSFTGSTEVGKLLIGQSAETVKKLSLELGGNAPFLVFEDADLNDAVAGAMFAKYRNAGQTCIGANRMLVARSIGAQFVSAFRAASEKLRVGNGLEPGMDLGPLINDEAVARVRRLVDDALSRGAQVVSGTVPDGTTRFVPPVILTGITNEMAIAHEEIFGPVTGITFFDDEAEALRLANDTRSGLAAYFYTRDLSRAVRVAESLEFGMVGINNTQISTAQAPFGGVKESGYGREGGRAGIEEYLVQKYVSIGL